MNKDAKITSIFATTRNGQVVRHPTAAALKRAEGIPPVETYPATHAMLDIEFNRNFGDSSHTNAYSPDLRAQEFHDFCIYQSQQVDITRNHYRMFSIKEDIPDTVLACCLNFYAALEIPLGAAKHLTDTRSHAAQIHLIWDQQTQVRQKDFDSLSEDNRFIFMDSLAKRLDVFLSPPIAVKMFANHRSSNLLHSIRKASAIDFGDTLLARKIRENMPAIDKKYRLFLNSTTSSRTTGCHIIYPQSS